MSCPKCGRYCSKITALANPERIVKVSGVCKKCGLVDLTDGPWDAEWFDVEETFQKAAEAIGR